MNESNKNKWDEIDEEAFRASKALWKANKNRVSVNMRRIDSKNRCLNRGTLTKNNWKMAS